MSSIQPVVSKLLVQILSQSPEPGARLKQRLSQALVANGYIGFNEKSLGYQKFTSYLLNEHGDTVQVTRPNGGGDIIVSLRSPVSTAHPEATNSSLSIRNDFWQAFVNPDPNRRRFLNRSTGEIEHFLISEETKKKEEEYRSSDAFVEIAPIPEQEQKAWMLNFISKHELSDTEKSTLEAIASERYSSSANNKFSHALGNARGQEWKHFRASRVIKAINAWIESNVIDRSVVHASQKSSYAPRTPELARLGLDTQPLSSGTNELNPKAQVLKLLDLLSDEDVTRVIIPTLLSTIMIRSRL